VAKHYGTGFILADASRLPTLTPMGRVHTFELNIGGDFAFPLGPKGLN
jgi:hypothetical protein